MQSSYSNLEIKEKVITAINILLNNDYFLLEKNVHERSISHKLAEYLQILFLNWNVDCEYNKHDIHTKILTRVCHDKSQNFVYPDICIHKRGIKENLLVIEIKTDDSIVATECDHAKLKLFTTSPGEYEYKLGLFIKFNNMNKPELTWFKKGNIKK